MATVYDVLKSLSEFAPPELAESWDNVGLICGYGNSNIHSVAVALDITDAVIDEAIKNSAELIITHHPVLFPPIYNITADNPTTALAYKLLKNGISVISMHTNLDTCKGGVADSLAECLQLCDTYVCGKFLRIGAIEKECSLKSYAAFVAQKLNTPHVSYVDSNRAVSKAAVAPGACDMEFLLDAIKENVDTIITGEAKYSICIYAKAAGTNLIIAGHHPTETVVLNKLCAVLSPLKINAFVCESDRNIIDTLYTRSDA